MASKKSNGFIDECIEHILKFSGPFDSFTDEAAAELDRYLTEEQVQIDERSRTREQWSQVESFKAPFFQRLALIGEFAKQAALIRLSTHREPAEELTALHLEDLQDAEPLVSRLSGSPGCTPDREP